MATLSNPTEIARETFRLLATRRIAPTPDNYLTVYNEVAGIADVATAPFPEAQLKSLLQTLPRQTQAQLRLTKDLEQALRDENWDAYRDRLTRYIDEQSAIEALPWGALIGDLLREWEAKQAGLTPGKKRDALDHVLVSAVGAETLHQRLQGLVRAWSQNVDTAEGLALVDAAPPAPETAAAATPAGEAAAPLRSSELLGELRDNFAFALETVFAAQLGDAPELEAQAKALAQTVRGAQSLEAMHAMLAELKRFAYRLELLADDRSELRGGLLHLLRLMIDNVSELVIDDKWLHGQIAMVREIIERPLNLRSIDDAERRIKEVVFKQGQLKHSLLEAKDALKSMLAGFVDHLAEFSYSTSDYHDKIEVCARRISAANDIAELADVVQEVMQETRTIRLNAQRARDELQLTRQRVADTEARIGQLQAELDKASTLVRHDQLTGAFNRRGLEEAFEKESARAARRQTPLCVALLDIDNFKKLNDSLGHDAGDAALIHLATIIRGAMRPQDTMARIGGEEFLLLLPETSLDEGAKALRRLQRELTKNFFMHDNQKLLITFSAGVTLWTANDTQASATKRADEGMYEAKQTGKNRVVTR